MIKNVNSYDLSFIAYKVLMEASVIQSASNKDAIVSSLKKIS